MRNTPLRTALVLALILACAGLVLAPAAHAAGPSSGLDGAFGSLWHRLEDRIAAWFEGIATTDMERVSNGSGFGMDPDGSPSPESGGGMDPDGSATPTSGHGMDPDGSPTPTSGFGMDPNG